ncbi:hypothetical protein M3C58_00500 [Brachybacterium muris]|nr:hypothetical protein [Brachybacterium muris]MCT1996698.1 hypothetical protein [Brachybacterium muris]MCT2296415.1 hypothetical protein [Brachybacterium muris]
MQLGVDRCVVKQDTVMCRETQASVRAVSLYSEAMRFERIFEDLEGRFAHHEQQEMRAVSEDLTRAERAQLTLVDRLRGASGARLIVHLGAGMRIQGDVEDVAADWLLLRESAGSTLALVPIERIAAVEGLASRARPGDDSPLGTLGLGGVLRRIARDRASVRIETTIGALTGRIAAVGADSLDVQTLPTGEASAVPGSTRITVSMDALVVLRIR